MSMYNDNMWGDPQNERVCLGNFMVVAEYAKNVSLGHWSFLGPGLETTWNARDTCKLRGEWERVAEIMMMNLSESGHPILRATSVLEQVTLKRKGGGNYPYTSVVIMTPLKLFSELLSLQLSIYGTVADMCEEFIPPLASTGNSVAMVKSESLVSPDNLLNVQKTTSDQ